MKLLYKILFALHLVVGIGALAGGLAAITNPNNPLGAPTSMLKNSPFTNFLIPGILLFTIIGLGNILSSLTLYFKSKFQGYISSTFTFALVIWIIVQCVMLRDVVFLHVLFFIIGLLGAILSVIILFNKNQFPANVIKAFYIKITK